MHDNPPIQRQFMGFGFLLYALFTAAFTLYLGSYPHPQTQQPSEYPPVDFATISQIPKRKSAFFDYFLPLIEAQNDRVLKMRRELMTWQQKLQTRPLNSYENKRLEQWVERYRVDQQQAGTELEKIDQLLLRVDVLPPSMVLAQAAMESAWGTSRFSRKGNNFFGQWCFDKGCGIVPKRRPIGAYHEVAAFDSPKESLRAYFLNLNSHQAYVEFRDLRMAKRAELQGLKGVDLVEGLSRYSTRGQEYIRELRQIIRSNKLSAYDQSLYQQLGISAPLDSPPQG